MQLRLSLVLAALAISSVAFGQSFAFGDGAYQIGYAANLNIGDSVVNITNDGWIAGPFNHTGVAGNTVGNICANIYVFDQSEEEISCCSCLTTPDGIYSLSAKSDLISNTLTPAVPNSIVIKMVGSTPGTTPTGQFTVCNPTTIMETAPPPTNLATPGLVAWGSTLEPGPTGSYYPVRVTFVSGGNVNSTGGYGPGFAGTAGTELNSLTTLCSFILSNGTGYGRCTSCASGALGGAKN